MWLKFDRVIFLCAVLLATPLFSLSLVAEEARDGTRTHEQILTTIAFGSCAKQSKPQPIWDQVIKREPGLFIWAGDNIYGDTEDMTVMRRKYDELSAIGGYKRLVESKAVILGTWDDHDYGLNDAGREYTMRAASQEVFLDFFGVAKDSVRREKEGVYHAEIFGEPGRRVQIVLLDTRYHRSPLQRFEPREGERRGPYRPSMDRDATILGEAQWSWLESQLRKPADLRLIVSSIQVIPSEHRFEKWMNIPRERARLLRLIQDTGAEGVILLSGDRHHAELSRLEPSRRSGLYPLYELTSSGLNQSQPRPGPNLEPNPYRVGRIFRGSHFGEVAIDWSQPDPGITLSIIDLQGRAVIEEHLQLSELKMPTYDEADSRFIPVEKLPGGAPLLTCAVERYDDDQAGLVLIDGNIDDWDGGQLGKADERYIYLRFKTDDQRTLRRHPERVTLGIDLDNDAETGSQASAWLRGCEVTIEVSPAPSGEGRRRYGPAVKIHHDGQYEEVGEEGYSINMAPTYASSWFEARISRTSIHPELAEVLTQQGQTTFRVIGQHSETNKVREIAAGSFTMPAYEKRTTFKSAEVPIKADDAVRLVSLNVLWATPQENPAPFTRLFDTIDADIYLLQEWDRARYSEDEIKKWFKDHVDASIDWSTMVTGSGSNGAGTAVVSRYPMTAKLLGFTPVEGGRWDFPARTAAAVVQTPKGSFLVGSVHFKAGGSLGSSEDLRRFQEAEAVNYLLRGMSAAAKPDVVVLGGDFNMNGSTQIVRLATQGLDLDTSPLSMLSPRVLGDPALLYTHGRGPSKNRLDYFTYSDATANVTEAFVLDSTILDDRSLKQAGLESADSHASDHLPVVIDLVPIQ
ncbi:MAG: alkaline phosphatase D family protein [Planctomycetota bacterium]